MVEKSCCICGKLFLAKAVNIQCCSSQCKIEKRKQSNVRYKKGSEYWSIHYPQLHAKRRIIKYCKICNCELPHGKQTYCLDCLLKMYVNDSKSKALHILNSRGLDKTMIQEELRERGWV